MIEIGEKPLVFNDGLNVFYGKNGSGKSTIYKSLINTLGNEHIHSKPNIHSEDEEVRVEIKVTNNEDDEKSLTYSGQQLSKTEVKVYDTRKMDFLIEPKREQFEIPILKQEVFNQIRNLFDLYTGSLDNKILEVTKRQDEIRTVFDEDFDLLKKSVDSIRSTLTENKFSEEDKRTLEEKRRKLKNSQKTRLN